MTSSKLRVPAKGMALDLLLDQELASMLADGIVKSPISFSALTTRLGLYSRSTLHTPSRKERIKLAIRMQLDASGTLPLKAQRRNQAERILEL